jgi:hypothetical protein
MDKVPDVFYYLLHHCQHAQEIEKQPCQKRMNKPPTSTPPSCSQNHCVTIKHRIAYAFATNKRGNRFGQLGRPKSSSKLDDALKTPKQIQFQTNDVQLIAAAAGGSKDSGHTLLLDLEGQVHACGCDRWQQLGLGSSEAGAVGYTWQGRLWHYTPQLVSALSSKTCSCCGGR